MLKLLIFTLFLKSSLFALQDSETMMLNAVDMITNTLHVGYAPAEWKEKFLGWNLDLESAKAKTKIRGQNLSLAEFHQVLKEFLFTAKDYHVGISFFSTEHAYLPFSVKGVSGRYFISYIDRSCLLEERFPFNIGDELLFFDGEKTFAAVSAVRDRDIGSTNAKTDLAMAAAYLTRRSGSFGHLVPKGDVELMVQSRRTGKISTHTMSWNYFPEKITQTLLQKTYEDLSPRELLLAATRKEFLYQRYKAHDDLFKEKEEDPGSLGSKKGFLPYLGPIIWEDETLEYFHAYIFEAKNKRIGYLRIPTYLGTDDHAYEFGELMGFFEEETEGLIIDQQNNPGGYLFYLYALTSMLTDVPLQFHKHKVNITQKDVMIALTLLPVFDEIENDDDAKDLFGNSMDGIDINLEVTRSFQSYFKYVVSEWDKGNTVMDACHIYGLNLLSPSAYERYTKPLLVLANELDFSSADFFPALMQDNKRGVILGAKTAGAGGVLTESSFPNLLGIDFFSYTGSLAERSDLTPIENFGVTPDILYELTENDVQNGYPDFKAKILETIEIVINGKIPSTFKATRR